MSMVTVLPFVLIHEVQKLTGNSQFLEPSRVNTQSPHRGWGGFGVIGSHFTVDAALTLRVWDLSFRGQVLKSIRVSKLGFGI